MERVNYNSLRFVEFFDNLNPKNSGIFFSILLHLSILLFAVGLPNLFSSKDIYVPNIIPIEILNISETTNIKTTNINNNENKKTIVKQKKFNSSNITEVQKQFEVEENIKSSNNQNEITIDTNSNNETELKEKKIIEVKQKKDLQTKTKVETIKSPKIKPKLKPKPKQKNINQSISDIEIKPKVKEEFKTEKKEIATKPKPKPKEDFSIASMLKDLRNEKSNNILDDESEIIEETKNDTGESESNENVTLSITEIDLLRQQLSGCWIAPAGAVINIGDKVTISAKIRENMKVIENSVRIVDTNIAKSNPFYAPITDSAMRTLLNPECTPLKLPKNKYSLWKNLTITFDYSIMKGY